MTIADRVAFYVEVHGSLRNAARALRMDAGYLSRLHSGEKTNPGPEVLKKLRLLKMVTIAYEVIPVRAIATPLNARTKSA